jgi:hypothetical protein
MAGQLIQIVGKQTYTLPFASGAAASVILGARGYDTRDANSGVLVVRVAGVSSVPTGGTFTVALSNGVVMPDDPATIYSIPSSSIASVTIAGTDTFPRLYLASFTVSSSPPCGPMVNVALSNTYGSAGGAGSITLGVELLIRDT